MKAIMSLISRDESGKILILALVLLVVGVLLLTPLLGLMSTGLTAGQVYERQTAELYAADAGIEDALWKIPRGEIPSGPYPLSVNQKDVTVTIETLEGAQLILDVLGLNEKPAKHSDWMMVYRSPEPGVFTVQVSYVGGAETKRINHVGAWLMGDYECSDEWRDSQAGFADIRDEYPVYVLESRPFEGGTAFIWSWTANDRPVFNPGDTKTLTFKFNPENTPAMGIGWVRAGSDDVYVSYETSPALYTIHSTAVSDTGEQTSVVAQAVDQCGTSDLVLLSWNVVTAGPDSHI